MSEISPELGIILEFDDIYDRLAAQELAIAALKAQAGRDIYFLPPYALGDEPMPPVDLVLLEERTHKMRYGQPGSRVRFCTDEMRSLSELVKATKEVRTNGRRPTVPLRIEAMLDEFLAMQNDQNQHSSRKI